MKEGGLELLYGFSFRDEDEGRLCRKNLWLRRSWVRIEEMIRRVWHSWVLEAEGNKSNMIMWAEGSRG